MLHDWNKEREDGTRGPPRPSLRYSRGGVAAAERTHLEGGGKEGVQRNDGEGREGAEACPGSEDRHDLREDCGPGARGFGLLLRLPPPL